MSSSLQGRTSASRLHNGKMRLTIPIGQLQRKNLGCADVGSKGLARDVVLKGGLATNLAPVMVRSKSRYLMLLPLNSSTWSLNG